MPFFNKGDRGQLSKAAAERDEALRLLKRSEQEVERKDAELADRDREDEIRQAEEEEARAEAHRKAEARLLTLQLLDRREIETKAAMHLARRGRKVPGNYLSLEQIAALRRLETDDD